MPALIGLHGRKGSGKDTAFGFLREWASERGLRAGRRGFADDLKLSFSRIFLPDITRDEAVLWCDRLKHTGTLVVCDTEVGDSGQITSLTHEITMRMGFQRYGTEGHRGVFGDNFWVDSLLPLEDWSVNFTPVMDFSGQPPEICVVTDVRFVNEAERIRELDGQIWQIDRDDDGNDQHASEQPLPEDLIDHYIDNNGNLDDLRENVIERAEENIA